jgi:hypothetical protein
VVVGGDGDDDLDGEGGFRYTARRPGGEDDEDRDGEEGLGIPRDDLGAKTTKTKMEREVAGHDQLTTTISPVTSRLHPPRSLLFKPATASADLDPPPRPLQPKPTQSGPTNLIPGYRATTIRMGGWWQGAKLTMTRMAA